MWPVKLNMNPECFSTFSQGNIRKTLAYIIWWQKRWWQM